MAKSEDLLNAVLKGDLNELRNLLYIFATQSDLDINYTTPEDGRSALHFAASTGNLECLELLLREVIVSIEAEIKSSPLFSFSSRVQ